MAEEDVDELIEEDDSGPEDLEEPDLEESDLEEPDLEEPDLEEMPDEDLLDDDLDVAVVDDLPDIPEVVTPAAGPASGDDEDEDEDEDEADEDDVEASLDVILKEKLVVADEEDNDETADQEERADTTTKVLPKRPDEFVCQSCFLVKHPSQLSDPDRLLCRDCV